MSFPYPLDKLLKISDEEYFAQKAVSQSLLRRLVIKQELYEVANGIQTEPTEAMNLGSAIHCLILEPAEFEKRYVVAPKFDLRLKADKEAKKAFLEEIGNKTPITTEDYSTAIECRDAFFESEAASLLDSGMAEAAVFTELDGAHTKIKLDNFCEQTGIILDFKSTQYDSDRFKKYLGDEGFSVQASLYRDVLLNAGYYPKHFIFIGIQTVKNKKITVVQQSREEYENGRALYKAGFALWGDIEKNTEKYKSKICRNAEDGTELFSLETPFYLQKRDRKSVV